MRTGGQPGMTVKVSCGLCGRLAGRWTVGGGKGTVRHESLRQRCSCRESSGWNNGGHCVELAFLGAAVRLRDSKDKANGPILIVTPGEWGRVPRRGERPRVQPAVAGGVFRRRSESCASRVSKHTRT
ncbi:MAG: DUF397 domain-containing protein [Pseudonocardiaceae bacterium]